MQSVKYVGLGVLDVIGIMFIGLKATQVINWSWFTVLVPFWIQIGSVLIVLILLYINLVLAKMKIKQ